MNIEKLKEKKTIKELLEFGIINIDKPAGYTSFDVCEKVKKIWGLRKTSHFGTLDPKVTGVLPVALNRACKLTGFFLGEDKEYAGEMRIHEEVPAEKIKKTIKEKFTGKIIQMPPVKSRVKRQYREREVKKFEILESKGKNIEFHAEVQGGTYIRKLIHDLGQELGINAHMTKLRRTRAGIFLEKDSVKLEDIKKENSEKIIIPAEEALLKIFPAIQVKESSVKQLFTGKPIYNEDLKNKVNAKKDDIIIAFSDNRFIGVYEVVKDRDIFAKAKFVLQPV